MWQDKFSEGSIELEEQLARLEKRYRWVHPYTLLRFSVSVVGHCNLNCKDCIACSPLIDEEYLDVAEYGRDCARLSKLFASEVKYVHLAGGEPLLHPDLTEIMRVTREAFPVGKIRLVTNGLLLPAMDDDFWNTCREYRIRLAPTEYPINFDYGMWEEYADAHGVLYDPMDHRNLNDKSGDKRMRRAMIGTTGRHIVEHNYYHCPWANNCLGLYHGRLYTCERPVLAHKLKKYFDLDIHLSERNGVDIYEVKDAYELMTKVNRPIPFCQYCNVEAFGYEESWGLSCKDRYEWIDFEWTRADIQYLKEAPSVYVYGAGEMGAKAAARLKENGIAVSAVLADGMDDHPGPIPDVPVIKARDVTSGGGVCLLAVDNAGKMRAGQAVSQCGFKQIIPLYVY